MDKLEIATTTPRVLDRCLSFLQDQPVADTHKSAPVTPSTKYSTHPDIQFFSSIKKKHHFEYHKQKHVMGHEYKYSGGLSGIGSSPQFDPYSRRQLLERIGTYNALNWTVPPSRESPSLNLHVLPLTLNELFCASNGWVCDPISRHDNFTNHLRCTACGSLLILRFNSIEETSYGLYLFDMDDIARLNDNLKVSYLSEIKQGAHSAACPWRDLLCSLQGTYYLTPYVGETNAVLVTEYLECLKNLLDHLPVLEKMAGFCMKIVEAHRESSVPGSGERFVADEQFVRVSKMWFLDRFHGDNKENFAAILDFVCPTWVYEVAAQGWKLSLQKSDDNAVLIMACGCCNQRLFVDDEVDSSANIHKHKWWCSHSKVVGDMSFDQYFHRMLESLENFIGPHGEYLIDQELSFSMDDMTARRKRRDSFDVNDGLERLTKLRKMYFVN